MGVLKLSRETDRIRWLRFKHDAADETIPGGAVMRMTDMADEAGMLYMGPPDQDNDTRVFINGPVAVEPLCEGVCARATPILAAFEDDGEEVTFMSQWGVAEGSFKLQRDKTGFLAIGKYDDGLIMVLAERGGSGGTITIREDDEDPTIVEAKKLTFYNQNFIVSDEGNGEAKVKTKGGTASEIVVASFNQETCQVTAKTLRFVDGLYQDSV